MINLIPGKLYITTNKTRYVYFNGVYPIFDDKSLFNVIEKNNILVYTNNVKSFQDFLYYQFLFGKELIYINYLQLNNVMLYDKWLYENT